MVLLVSQSHCSVVEVFEAEVAGLGEWELSGQDFDYKSAANWGWSMGSSECLVGCKGQGSKVIGSLGLGFGGCWEGSCWEGDT